MGLQVTMNTIIPKAVIQNSTWKIKIHNRQGLHKKSTKITTTVENCSHNLAVLYRNHSFYTALQTHRTIINSYGDRNSKTDVSSIEKLCLFYIWPLSQPSSTEHETQSYTMSTK